MEKEKSLAESGELEYMRELGSMAGTREHDVESKSSPELHEALDRGSSRRYANRTGETCFLVRCVRQSWNGRPQYCVTTPVLSGASAPLWEHLDQLA
jgi:hypothetical protein